MTISQISQPNIQEQLSESLRSWWSVEPHPHYPGRWFIRVPFYYGDGDGMTVCLAHDDDGWFLTDHGFTVFHMFVDEFSGFVFKGVDRIKPVIVDSGLEVHDPGLELVMRVKPPEEPSADHVGSFLMALERVRGAALVHTVGYHNSCNCCVIRYTDSSTPDEEDYK